MRGLTLIAALLVAGSVPAQDGALEINQACIEDGCFAGDQAGFPVWITKGGLYRLTSDLVVSDDRGGIYVRPGVENRVTIDLNGFSITGPNSCSGKPVTSCSGPNSSDGVNLYSGPVVRVQDGHIAGFEVGVRCNGACELENLTLAHNARYGASQAYGNNDHAMVVRNSSFISNGYRGLRTTDEGSMVVGSIFKWNKEAGARVSYGVFLNNVVWNNGEKSAFYGTLVSRNTFSRDVADPYDSGVSAGDNACSGTLC